MRTAHLLIFLLAAGLGATEFEAQEFFGKAHFQPVAGLGGRLGLKLDQSSVPSFVELNNSDDGPASACFEFTQTGAVLRPAGEQASCELGLDVGVVSCNASISLVELDVGASAGFHLVDLENERQYVVEVRRGQSETTLRIAKRTRNGMVPMGSGVVQVTGADFKRAQSLSIHADSGVIKAEFSGANVEYAARGEAALHAISIGIVGSGGRSRVANFEADLNFDPTWAEHAQSRLEARRVLARLNEYSTQSLLSGISVYAHPTQESDLKLYSEAETRARKDALADTALTPRFHALDALAKAKPQNALALYEAGMAALVAGHSFIARDRLEASLKSHECGMARLVLAEACRRLRAFDDAQTNLDKSKQKLAAGLEPEVELLHGRLLAARGEMVKAYRTLENASLKWPKHEQLKAFAQSARELLGGDTLGKPLTEIQGPFGLTLLSDLQDDTLLKVLKRLEPFAAKIAYWLPSLAAKLEGVIAIYSTPTAYLRAALLVAGDSLDNVAGMFLPAGFDGKRSVIACRAFGEDELVRTLAHELWHLAVSTTEQAMMEPWLNEGMAVYISAGKVREGVMSYRDLPTEFASFTTEISKAMTSLEAAQSAMDAGLERFYLPGEQRMNYSIAWALVWFYAEQDMASARALRELLSAVPGSRKVLRDSLGQLLPRIAKALKDRKMLP
ncbi:hypothetical protein PLCT2_02642 [Planctomycetaceae bacterium]|nr:hypothetical protein PLCT2_02642 [Planctomycetaceae bacterium]